MSTSAWTPVDESKWKPVPDEETPPSVPKAPIPSGLQGPPAQKPHGDAVMRAQQSEPYSSEGGAAGAGMTTLRNLGAGATRIFDPRNYAAPLAAAMGNPAAVGQAGNAAASGISSLLPGKNEQKGQYAGRLGGEAVANVPALVLGKTAAGAEMPESPEIGLLQRDPLKAYRSPLIPTEEAQARTITDKLGVPQSAYPQTLKSIQSNLGNIKESGSLVGGKYKTPLEFGKVAQAAGQPAHDLLQSQLIEPNAEAMTPHGSVGDIYKEISEINRQLGPAYRRGLPGQTESLLERKQMADLSDRKNMLTDTLYNELSSRSGVPVDEIRRMNMQGAGLQDVGHEADAAQVMRNQGYSQPGIPFSKSQAIGRLVQSLRGGPERVAGRTISKVMEGVNQPSTPLPSPEDIGNYRGLVEKEDLGKLRDTIGSQQANLAASQARKPSLMGPTKPPEASLIQPPDNYAQNFVDKLRQRGAENKANALPPPEPVPQENPMNKYLTGARERQKQAGLLRRNQ